MRRRNAVEFLRELSPEMLGYLFPGLEHPELFISYPTPTVDEDLCFCARFEDEVMPMAAPMPRKERKECRITAAPTEIRFSVPPKTVPEEEQLDPRTERILAEIRRLQEMYDVSIDELEVLLGYTVRLSPLHILKGGRIYMTDFDNREVRMPNISKALYFFYLRHPEGLRFKEIIDHKDELLHIYESISGRDDPEEMEKSIDLLVDPYGNALNVNASRIKTAFRNIVSDRVACFYYINGGAGDVKKVPLDRDLVIWEY